MRGEFLLTPRSVVGRVPDNESANGNLEASCSENPATWPTESPNGSSPAGSVCSVNTLRPCCGPTGFLGYCGHWVHAAKNDFGYSPSVSPDDGLARLAAWHRAQHGWSLLRPCSSSAFSGFDRLGTQTLGLALRSYSHRRLTLQESINKQTREEIRSGITPSASSSNSGGQP